MASATTTATSNPVLTNYAAGLMQDVASALADFICPPVTVASTVGHYKKYDDKNPFQALDTARAVGGPARRIDFAASDPTYNCQPQALEIGIDDAERDAANPDDPLILEQAKIRTLVTTAALSHEDAVFTYIAAQVAATAGLGNWSNPDIDPVAQVNQVIRTISNNTGRVPNRIVMGIAAWEAFVGHTKVRERFPGAIVVGPSPQQASGLFLIQGLEIRVGFLAKDSTKFPLTKSTGNVVGSTAYVFYASQTPDLYDPSFAKCFVGGSGGIAAVRSYRDESARSDILAIDWSRDIQVVNSAACAKLTIT